MELVKKIKKNRKTMKRWKDCDVLVIDEISMIRFYAYEYCLLFLNSQIVYSNASSLTVSFLFLVASCSISSKSFREKSERVHFLSVGSNSSSAGTSISCRPSSTTYAPEWRCALWCFFFAFLSAMLWTSLCFNSL